MLPGDEDPPLRHRKAVCHVEKGDKCMKVVFTVGTDSPRAKVGVFAVLKYAVVGILALLAMNRSDIRRYMRLRRM
jgi:hypothetical protein